MTTVKDLVLFSLTAPGIFFYIIFINALVFSSKKAGSWYKIFTLLSSLIIAYVSTTSIVTKQIMYKLEGACSSDNTNIDGVDAIAVLTAGNSEQANLSRLIKSAALYNQIKKPLIILGGITNQSEPAESVTASKSLISIGVPENKIITEEKSTNTLENIVELKKLITAHAFKHVALVSSASHLKRVELLIKDQKIKATLIPTGCYASQRIELDDLAPSINNMELNRGLLYEILGNFKYQNMLKLK